MVAAADAAYMMMMPGLRRADGGLVADDLLAVFAELAVHGIGARTGQRFVHPIGESIDQQRVVVEIARLEEFDLRMLGGGGIRPIVDATHQDAGEKKVGEHDDALEPQPHGMGQTGIDQRIGNAAEADLGPAEAHAFPQHTGDLGDVGIGIGIVGAAPDDHQQCIFTLDLARRYPFGGFDAFGRGAQQAGIDGQIAGHAHVDAGIGGGEIVDLGRHVVLHMAGGEQHAGQADDSRDAACLQLFQAIADNRTGEFEKAAFHVELRETPAQVACERIEFGDGSLIAAAVAADHHGLTVGHSYPLRLGLAFERGCADAA